MTLANGARIGDFTIQRLLAQGGMGSVYVARQGATGALRALKVMHPVFGSDPRLHARFEQEARASALVPSDHVVEIVAAGVDPGLGLAWLAMELLDGVDLGSYIASRARLAHAEVGEILSQVAHALAAAHGVGVVHRDLKPENVFLANRRMVGVPYIVKVLDFGIAKLVSESSALTAALGTPGYMAPEQAHGQGAITAVTDVWAFGLLAFEMLTGSSFWRAGEDAGLAAILREVILDPIPLASERAAEELVPGVLPEGFDAWLSMCLARNPSDRFASVTLAADALDAMLRPEGPEPRRITGLIEVERGASPMADTRPRPREHGETVDASVSPRSVAAPLSSPVARGAKRGLRVVYRERFGKTIAAAQPGQSVLEVSIENEVAHHHVCGGRARCTTCRVYVHEGADQLAPRTAAEAQVATQRGWSKEIRLACQARLAPEARGDVVVRRLVVDHQDAEDVQSSSGDVARFLEQRAVVLVARLEGLASFAARHLPYDAMHIASRAGRTLAELVTAHRGQVVSLHGARLVAIFPITEERNDKVASLDAVRAAARMAPRMALVNAYLGENFGEVLSIAVGLHAGSVFAGKLEETSMPMLLGEPVEIAEDIAARAGAQRVGIAASATVVGALGELLALGTTLAPSLAGALAVETHEIRGFAKPDPTFLVQSTFEQILPAADAFAQRFYDRLFLTTPEVKPMFAHVEMPKQRKMLLDVLASAVRGLDDLPSIVPVLQSLGRRHVGYGVSTKHYRAVGEALLWSLDQHFGEALSPEAHLAWREVYGILARTMIDAAREQPAA